MNDTSKKVGYLKGLLEGLELDNSPNAKLLKGIVDVLNDLSDRVNTIDDLLDDLNDYVESIDDDLTALEQGESTDRGFYHDDDDFDYDFDEDDEDAEDHLHLLNSSDDEDDEDVYHFGPGYDDDEEPADEPEPLAGCLCPECSRMFFISLDDPEDSAYRCPHCSEKVIPVPLTPENAPIAKPEN